MSWLKLLAVLEALLSVSLPASAHHAFAAQYDVDKIVTVSGIVTRFTWTNPHAWLYIYGNDESGKVAAWSFEMTSPTGLIHRGWSRADLKKGDHVVIDGYAAKDGSNLANARLVTLANGRKLFGGFRSTSAASAK